MLCRLIIIVVQYVHFGQHSHYNELCIMKGITNLKMLRINSAKTRIRKSSRKSCAYISFHQVYQYQASKRTNESTYNQYKSLNQFNYLFD